MYSNGFVCSIKINGKTVEEKDGKVVVPFDSEYCIFLKNRNDRKAVARVYIDGDEVTEKGRLIIDANNSVNLERYLDNMDNGKKFKFVPISDNRVNDKGDSEKGFIEVRFQLVKPVLNNFIIHEEHVYHKKHHYWNDWWDYSWYKRPYYFDFPTITYGGGHTCDCNSFNLMSYNCASTNKATIQDNHLVEERGATIKGGDSSQKFSYAYVGELESIETVIRFQLVGTNDEKITNQYLKTHCVKCGKKYDTNDNFCAKCGQAK